MYTPKKVLVFEISLCEQPEPIIPPAQSVASNQQQQQQHIRGGGGRVFHQNKRGFRGGGKRGGFRGRGNRGGRSNQSSYKSGETDPYDMTIAPLNIYENQVIPVGLHNLSKSFRPNLSTIRVLSLGTKFIPKWKFEKRNNAFLYFKDFLRKMQNKVYFTETKSGFSEKNSKFKVKSNWEANTIHKEVEAFGWKVRDKISEMIESKIHEKTGQNISNKEKTALRNLISAKNKNIVINDTDKNMGAADADKKDVVDECVRQLHEEKTYLKLTEEELKNIISEIQTKLKHTVESHLYKGNCTKKEAEFLLSKMYIYDIPHFYIIWKILKNPIVGRPICAGYNWILTPASIFVGHFLKEFYSKFENILTDSLSLVKIL